MIHQATDNYSLITIIKSRRKRLPSAGNSDAGGDNLPVGTILPFTVYKGSLASIPEKWAICNGSNGTPDLTGRFLEGVTSSPGSTKSAGLPNITGSDITSTNGSTWYWNKWSGALIASKNNSVPDAWMIQNTELKKAKQVMISFDASKSNATCAAIYRDDVTTVQPNSYTVMYIMKIKA